MKTTVKTLLARVGLAPAGQITALTAQVRQADKRVHEIDERLATLRADVESWKQRYETSTASAAEWKQAAATATAKAERAATAADRAEAQVEEWKARAEKLTSQVGALRDKLQQASHATTMAKEHLMATEVKLDLIEAAIQVLDARSRDAAVHPS